MGSPVDGPVRGVVGVIRCVASQEDHVKIGLGRLLIVHRVDPEGLGRGPIRRQLQR